MIQLKSAERGTRRVFLQEKEGDIADRGGEDAKRDRTSAKNPKIPWMT